MKVPEGQNEIDRKYTICRLGKLLYGLYLASRKSSENIESFFAIFYQVCRQTMLSSSGRRTKML